MIYPNKLKKGDNVAFLSSSYGLNNKFPWIGELGVDRIKDVFGLNAINFDLSSDVEMSVEDRVESLHRAFGDKSIKAIFAYIGGLDQLSLLKHLDTDLIKNNPKPFFGYSDNTQLHLLINSLGIVSYYGGSVMTQIAMHGKMDEYTVESMNNALFSAEEWVEIKPADAFNEVGLDWSDKNLLSSSREYQDSDGWYWSVGSDTKTIEGQLWGGCTESIQMAIVADNCIPADWSDKILFLETSEEIPPAEFSRRFLCTLGIRGVLEQIRGVIVGRPKAWEFDQPKPLNKRNLYRQECQVAFESEIRKFNSNIPIIQNMDFGHTDPQIMLPSGGQCRIDTSNKKVWLKYN